MVSEIRSEDGLKTIIEEIKNKNENNYKKEYNIYIDFEQSNSKNIKFISNFILNNFKKDKYHYIFIIHISRITKTEYNTTTSPDINTSNNQNKNSKLNKN